MTPRQPRSAPGTPARREFLRWLAGSPLLVPAAAAALLRAEVARALAAGGIDGVTRVAQLEGLARGKLDREVYDFIAGGADDEKTVHANREAYDRVGIRARRLVDVSSIDTSVRILGELMETPLMLAPVGTQGTMHAEGELGTARAAAARKHTMIASTVTTYSIAEIRVAYGSPVWFQLYPTMDREITKALLERAEAAGCEVCVLTVDTPVVGNRESQRGFIASLLSSGDPRLGNFDDLGVPPGIDNPAYTWDFVDWLREQTRMKLVIKGVVTHEDARLCVESGVDGLVVSNHGGRQLESLRGTFDCLPEVVGAVAGRIAVLHDGGVLRGTDIFKALALGADAVCIGRAYVWGLAAYGRRGVEHVLDILRAELVRDMQLAGTPSIAAISPASVSRRLQSGTRPAPTRPPSGVEPQSSAGRPVKFA